MKNISKINSDYIDKKKLDSEIAEWLATTDGRWWYAKYSCFFFNKNNNKMYQTIYVSNISYNAIRRKTIKVTDKQS